ncbi:MAG: protein kinase [Myxococcales bacterium]
MIPTFGRYELLKRLAGGGMGEVYLARQRGIDGFSKLLVIKTLLAHLCEDEEFITMFKDEARVTAQLIHPNICQVFEFEQVGGVYYMSMEYLRGEDLRRLWKACEQKGTPLRVPLICRVISDAAAGLDFAHSLRDSKGEPYNIVHRDISPQNILVTFEGGVKIIDFGVAKAAGRAQHTRTGALKGKYSYMSPEQVAGSEVDGRSDIFALGIVLHELLTGRRLFKADSDVQTLARVRECNVAPPSRLNPQLPPGLDAIVLKALAKNPDDRYRTAQEFRLAVEDWLIQGRMSAASAHLAEFLKTIYAERLDKEARLGPLMGEAPFAGPAPGGTPATNGNNPAGQTPSPPTFDPKGKAAPMTARSEPTVNQRTSPTALSGGGEVVDPSTARTWSDAGPFKSNNRMRVTVGALAFAIAIAAVVVLLPGKKDAKVAPEPAAAEVTLNVEPETATVLVDGAPSPKQFRHKAGPARIEIQADGYVPQTLSSISPGPQTQTITLQKAAPRVHVVTISTEPAASEIYEGTRLIGKSPKVWTDATEGEHQLILRRDGYHEETGKVVVAKDGEEFNFKLRKLESARKSAPDLGIKAER